VKVAPFAFRNRGEAFGAGGGHSRNLKLSNEEKRPMITEDRRIAVVYRR
jgi:hypothetical protein